MYNAYPSKRDKAAIDDTTMFQYITYRYLDSQFFGIYQHNNVKSSKNYTKCKSERVKADVAIICCAWIDNIQTLVHKIVWITNTIPLSVTHGWPHSNMRWCSEQYDHILQCCV
jgi:hypothetical protein